MEASKCARALGAFKYLASFAVIWSFSLPADVWLNFSVCLAYSSRDQCGSLHITTTERDPVWFRQTKHKTSERRIMKSVGLHKHPLAWKELHAACWLALHHNTTAGTKLWISYLPLVPCTEGTGEGKACIASFYFKSRISKIDCPTDITELSGTASEADQQTGKYLH